MLLRLARRLPGGRRREALGRPLTSEAGERVQVAERSRRGLVVSGGRSKKRWAVRLGLEVHAPILARTKMFSAAPGTWRGGDGAREGVGREATERAFGPTMSDDPVADGAWPNAAVALVDMAAPGALPMLSRHTLEQAARAALALRGRLQRRSVFERKHYLYVDLPHGYQITQRERPVMLGGALRVPVPDVAADGRRAGAVWPLWVPLERVQLETDTGRSVHDVDNVTLVDLDRAGTGLMEIVTRPTLPSPEAAGAFVLRLQRVLRLCGVSDGRTDTGSMRCDVNVSLHELDAQSGAAQAAQQAEEAEALFAGLQPSWGEGEDAAWRAGVDHLSAALRAGVVRDHERVELKNLSTVRAVVRGAWHEIARQAEVLDGGGSVERSTRGYDVATNRSRLLRTKEDLPDYRFAVEPDLRPVLIPQRLFREAARDAGEAPRLDAVEDELAERCGLQYGDAVLLASAPGAAHFLQAALHAASPPLSRAAASVLARLLQHELLGRLGVRVAAAAGHDDDDHHQQHQHAAEAADAQAPRGAPPWTAAGVLEAVRAPLAGPVAPAQLASLAQLLADDRISSLTAKRVLDVWFGQEPAAAAAGALAADVVEANQWWMARADDADLAALCDRALDAEADGGRDAADRWLGPRQHQKAIGPIVGRILKLSAGRADPKQVVPALRAALLRRFPHLAEIASSQSSDGSSSASSSGGGGSGASPSSPHARAH
jgi:Asp-tRNA(Asn)/Glu-tRNA(Gln) amidotransferase B subunit